MSRREKLIERFRSYPKDFTWQELVKVLEGLGYARSRTGGKQAVRVADLFTRMRRVFYCINRTPATYLKRYMLEQVLQHLDDEGLL